MCSPEARRPQTLSARAHARALFRCNLACRLRKIQYPAQILKKNLTVEQCIAAVDECGTPVVSIPGGSRCVPDIGPLVKALIARRKYVYLCTNAILLKEKLEAGLFTPSKYFSFSVHLDGQREEHDEAVCRDGVYVQAVEGIKEALRRGFRVTTNSTLFDGASPLRMREFFDEMMDLGVEGMMISPGYSYSKAPDQEHFLRTQRAHDLFSRILSNPKAGGGSIAAVPAVPDGQAEFDRRRGEPDLRLRLAASLISFRSYAARQAIETPAGRTTESGAATKSAVTAWCTAVTSRPL
jgi:hopanoid biosynthesis associated radical SAM protein HpnH